MNVHSEFKPGHFSDPKVVPLQTTLRGRVPFYSGTCTIPDYQRLLYYSDGDLRRRIDFSGAKTDELEALSRACKPAEFGQNGENVLDESYRKAGKMDLTSFATLFDPRSLGVHEQISKALLTQSLATMNMELYKLNVYGKGDFFKVHKDTPRSPDMFGSLVVVFPTAHEGGQFVLRHGGKEWTIDFAEKLAGTTEPSVCFVAFYSDVEHEVLPVTSGYRVTLTYNLHGKPNHGSDITPIPTPFHLQLKKELVDLVNDKSVLPQGGYLGFGLAHEYVHTGHNLLELLPGQLKGSDRAMAEVCDKLGLRYSLKLLYRGITDPQINLLTTKELEVPEDITEDPYYGELMSSEYLQHVIEDMTTEQVEGVDFIGSPDKLGRWMLEDGWHEHLRPFYKDPTTEVLEVTPMESSVDFTTSFMAYGNEAELGHFYGTACMLVAVDPAASRKLIGS